MANEDLTTSITQLKLNEGVDVTVVTEAATTNDKDYEFEATHDNFILLIENTATVDDVVVEIAAGDFWQKDNSEYVPLTATVGTQSIGAIGPLESAKYINSDGKIVFNADIDGTTDDVSDLEFMVLFMPGIGVARA